MYSKIPPCWFSRALIFDINQANGKCRVTKMKAWKTIDLHPHVKLETLTH